MANTYSLVTTNITDTAVDIGVISTTGPSTTAASLTIAIFKAGETGGMSQSLSDPGTNYGQSIGTVSFATLTPSTQYIVRLTGAPNVTTTSANFTTKIDRNTPRSATQEQWEYLVSKIKDLDSRISTIEN